MSNYLENVKKQFEYYKMLGDKALIQVPDDKLFWKFNENSNSIAIIVNHLWGNMLSRWTDFLTADGEKEWRIDGMTQEQRKLSIRGVWNDTLLVERINACWTPETDPVM